MTFKHNLPLIFFTIIMPGVVFGYYFYFELGFWMHLALFLLGSITLGLASFHLGKPQCAPKGITNFCSSWFSREALFFALFFLGLFLQLFFIELCEPLMVKTLFILGLFGLMSTIFLYRTTGRVKFWPIELDFLIDGMVLGWLFPLNPELIKYNFLTIVCLAKISKDLIVGFLVISCEKNKLAILTVLLAFLSIFTIQYNLKITYLFWVVNMFLHRAIFFTHLEQHPIAKTKKRLRKTYLPKEYHRYFR